MHLPVRRELVDGAGRSRALRRRPRPGRAPGRRTCRREHLDAIYASPLRRARQTAEAVAARQSLDVQVSDGVAEWDRLSNEYIPIEELKAANDPR